MILLDTSGLLAAMFSDQADHEACRAVVEQTSPPLLLSPFVLAELDYLVMTRAGVDAEMALMEQVATRAYELVAFDAQDVARCREVAARFADLAIGLADASVAVLSERFGCLDVLTLDQRHFRTLRGARGRPLRLLPSDL